MRKYEGIQLYDTNFRKLNPQTCFEDVTADGTNTILLIPDSEKKGIEFPPAPGTNSESQTNLAYNLKAEQEGKAKRKKGRLGI
jgi:hypothetical protein